MSISEEEVRLLRSWLFSRVGDDTDAVVDDLQEENSEELGRKDEEEGEIQGTEEYRRNLRDVAEKVKQLKEKGCREGR